MKPLLATLALLLLAGVASAELDIEDLRASVVSVDVTSQSEDYWQPWQRPGPGGTGGSGFYIGERRLMTNAHVVSDAKVIRVKRPDRPDRVDARVLYVGHDCDLAMLTVDDPTFFDGMIPLQFGDVPKLRTTVTAVGYPVGGRKISITKGVISRIELHNYVHTGVDRHLTIQIDAAINPGNSGGCVIQEDKVVGVAFMVQFFSQNIGYMIPTTVIRHFMKDIEDGKYDGYPKLGILTANLENDALRAYLKVPEGETGVLILKALPFSSCEGIIQRNDVLHAVDEYKVENDGTVKVGEEFLELSYVVEGKHVGDTVTLKIRRDGKPMEVPVKLKIWKVKMQPGTEYEKKPEFLVLGGYVFVPLTSNYTSRSGWRSDLRYWLNEFYRSLAEERPGQTQLVVLSRVLRHNSTRYRNYSNAVVKTVNGERPTDFKHFVTMIETNDRSVIEFEGINVEPLVLDKNMIAGVHKEILEKYGISEDRYMREGE
ncbi:MAG: S1C family serine protease [Planctomycetota bacterium]|jgi:S1-C subfamily serine protease